jgi:hypothetical protein
MDDRDFEELDLEPRTPEEPLVSDFPFDCDSFVIPFLVFFLTVVSLLWFPSSTVTLSDSHPLTAINALNYSLESSIYGLASSAQELRFSIHYSAIATVSSIPIAGSFLFIPSDGAVCSRPIAPRVLAVTDRGFSEEITIFEIKPITFKRAIVNLTIQNGDGRMPGVVVASWTMRDPRFFYFSVGVRCCYLLIAAACLISRLESCSASPVRLPQQVLTAVCTALFALRVNPLLLRDSGLARLLDQRLSDLFLSYFMFYALALMTFFRKKNQRPFLVAWAVFAGVALLVLVRGDLGRARLAVANFFVALYAWAVIAAWFEARAEERHRLAFDGLAGAAVILGWVGRAQWLRWSDSGLLVDIPLFGLFVQLMEYGHVNWSQLRSKYKGLLVETSDASGELWVTLREEEEQSN